MEEFDRHIVADNYDRSCDVLVLLEAQCYTSFQLDSEPVFNESNKVNINKSKSTQCFSLHTMCLYIDEIWPHRSSKCACTIKCCDLLRGKNNIPTLKSCLSKEKNIYICP